ncbi:MAG: rod shape-determining protein MreD [Sedimentisphaerales bacterium]|nr:rod shape-determining protein MreD [Sedimentisphaerales bacterium]
MRWISFGILVVVTVIVQSGFGRLLGLGPQRIMPDLLLLWAVVIAFRGNKEQAPLACWLLGLAKDLTSSAILGSYAVGFGLMGLALVYFRELLYGESALLLILLTLVSSLLVEHITLLFATLRGEFSRQEYGGALKVILLTAILTAALSPYGQWLLMKMYRQFGLARRRH